MKLPWKKEKTLDQIEEADERVTAEVSLAEKQVLLAKLKKEYGDDGIKIFSKNGLRSGINWSELKFRLGQGKR